MLKTCVGFSHFLFSPLWSRDGGSPGLKPWSSPSMSSFSQYQSRSRSQEPTSIKITLDVEYFPWNPLLPQFFLVTRLYLFTEIILCGENCVGCSGIREGDNACCQSELAHLSRWLEHRRFHKDPNNYKLALFKNEF